jgi:hypothetical protein
LKYFIDTEFAEKPHTIEIISAALVAEDGREFYAERADFNPADANPWVLANVIPRLWSQQKDKAEYNAWHRDGGAGGLLFRDEIGPAVRRFIGDDAPEFWGYYADYDWVVFCWLFGAMVDLPKGWPMYCRDLKQWSDQIGAPKFEAPKGEHNALADARWNKSLYEHLITFKASASRSS